MIEITINGEQKEVQAGQSVAGLLKELGVLKHILAVELNGEVVAREHFEDETVAQGDILELFRLIGGG